ncbi:enoyl-CoA hydratase/isomerase family protein [Parvibaculum sp.]|jgi:enoyl-CoA hydratase|uniref:enoyl-CoA hydratase/isomerase family protein n=1 Tax=Parvibaculum sp. TaxID=2024848 RepID=UPI000C50C486|nr:enoyl-CoA hydratase/isomerase family protein [Parvibaculum sp.]MAM94402.1 enoyl-CoA hydratase [Parvibaculum sp.]HCX67388.1 enoyl-CoA hydratase [Rhodobiaceae bacterium]|tara:strand:- start:2190 stop:2930 length:741 start_codon:yes stop_codon:yes gene_type:complete
MSNLVLREDSERICTLTLNRPETLNALNVPLFEELRGHVDTLRGQVHEVACVIITGAGKAFSAGHDLKDIQKGERPPEPHFQAKTIQALAELPQPVIACVRGHCYTGGLELALAADIIIAARSAKFGDTHSKWGLSPLWGMTQRLPRRVGLSKAKQMMFTSDILAAETAERMGLVDICVDDAELEQATNDLAQRIAANSTYSNQVNKGLLGATDGMTCQAGLAYELAHSPGACFDARERVASFGKK